MLRSFLIITLRILWRNKVTSFINIFSLSIGITAFILIMLYVHHEMSYDKFNENYDRIYRLEANDYGCLPPAIGDFVMDKVPEVESVARLSQVRYKYIGLITEDNPVELKEIQAHTAYADSTVFDIFTMSFIQGDPRSALADPFTVVLTESTARKLFGDNNPIGETIWYGPLNRSNPFRITGIIQDVKKSHIKIDALFSLESFKLIHPDRNLNKEFSHLWNATYLLLVKNADPERAQEKINDVLADVNDGNLMSIEFKDFHLLTLKDVYFKGTTTYLQYGEHGNRKLVLSFMTAAIFILALAIINYINLTTARASLRIKEVAMKKVFGSTKRLLRFQFILESILVTLIAFLLAVTLVQGLMPQFNQLAMINIQLAEFNILTVWVLTILIILFIGAVSGIYPAFVLTLMKSFSILKGKTMKGSRGAFFRGLLLTFQFSISILLIIGIITNVRQLHYIKHADLGFDKEQVITTKVPSHIEEEDRLKQIIKERLLQYPSILKVAMSTRELGTSQLGAGPTLDIDGTARSFGFQLIDPDYLDLMDIEIVEGRNFSWERISDKPSSEKFGIIVNETAARQYWTESPVGKIYNYENKKWEVIGVAEDFHFYSLHRSIEPMFFFWGLHPANLSIKVASTDIPATIKLIEREWKKVYGATPFRYKFLDENIENQYKSDEQTAKIIGYFTILAIIIACMGLFALSSFMVVRRTKEIGIRKAMGASTNNIFIMLSREFVKWVLIAVIVACPIAWFLMDKWLQGFAYKINLGMDIFIFAALITLVIALATVAWQSLKSALANPAKTLRYE